MALDLVKNRKVRKLILWDIQIELLEEFADELRKSFRNIDIITMHVNLAKPEEIYANAEIVKSKHGDVEVLINNAGIVTGSYFMDSLDERNELTMRVNCFAHMYMIKAFAPAMIEKNKGSICGIVSVASYISSPGLADYSASKFACRGFLEGLNGELKQMGKSGVKITCVCPSHINTELFKGFDQMGNVTIEPEYVAYETLNAIENGKELVILPSYLSPLPISKGAWEFLGNLGFPNLDGSNPLKQWDGKVADKVFNKMGSKL